MAKEIIIQIRDLIKSYSRKVAINGVNLDIYKSEIFGLLGPNGAGKSTLLSMMATVSKPTSGDIYIKDISLVKQAHLVKKLIGFVPQEIALYTKLSGIDNLKFWGQVYGLRGRVLQERIEYVLFVVALQDRIKDPVDHYSGGMKRRLNIAASLLHNPQILIMDEPTAGVDVESRRCILSAVKKLSEEGTTVIYTSHYLEEVDGICHRLAFLKEGRIETVGTMAELEGYFATSNKKTK
ncbi:MAG: ABC transporter ATP-binding protein [Bacillota bacterium]|uniref:ATP-binding cassette domain-containing protein n=1 Tax=Thermanaerosceptrum fracticalcis TaxID=1712410 RepID=A0A7G6E742_THEFR|nr:ABC transporter ATP-binding protein [Thermanaerosceptrum fracticalcis]QNB47896.1 ATP-binding cassette domain-containing protein [Thermanaerosceptrum fracticalcis]